MWIPRSQVLPYRPDVVTGLRAHSPLGLRTTLLSLRDFVRHSSHVFGLFEPHGLIQSVEFSGQITGVVAVPFSGIFPTQGLN